jgi:uncharacterized protein
MGEAAMAVMQNQRPKKMSVAQPKAPDIQERVTALDWTAIFSDLDSCGCATTGPLLTRDECAVLAQSYAEDEPFRSRIIMARHGFGRGEYKYFAYPLPDIVAALRGALYPPLAEVATRWSKTMGADVAYPADHAAYLQRCHKAGQSKPTPLLLQYGTGDYNCLHQDIYGANIFPLQVAFLLSRPAQDFTGGEFVLTEQRPRMQSRGSGAAPPRRRRDLSGASSPGARHARHLSGQYAPRRQPSALGQPLYARRYFSRCGIEHDPEKACPRT